MAPLPAALDPQARLIAWRLDKQAHAQDWDSGEGARLFGGRWNPKELSVVYCSLDPATCIMEAAVHKGFPVLDTQRHILTSMQILDPGSVRIIRPGDVPNPAWLDSGTPSAGQQRWGADLLAQHPFVMFPSVVSKRSWNLVFQPSMAEGRYLLVDQEALSIDGRLNPPAP